jgi:hypothetical protein
LKSASVARNLAGKRPEGDVFWLLEWQLVANGLGTQIQPEWAFSDAKLAEPLPMPIVVTCACGQTSEARESVIGMDLPCPACGRAISVNVPQVGPVVACQCGQRFRADPRLIGTVVACPACRRSISVPHPATQSIFDELPLGPIAARPTPPPAAAPQLAPARCCLRGRPFQTAWLLYNRLPPMKRKGNPASRDENARALRRSDVFVEMLISKPWLIPIGIPFLIALWTLGLKLVLPKSRDDG